MKRTLLTLIFFIFVYSVLAQLRSPNGRAMSSQQVDAIITHLMDTAGVTGFCIGVINDNRPAYVQAYGYKNAAPGGRNDTATAFYGASLSKAVFAWLVMQLVDSGIIDLDKPLYTYLAKPLPEYPYYKDLAGDDRWKLITARHCLDHTTGFPNWKWFNPRGNEKLEIFFTPGSRYAYSGEGLFLLQLVIEEKTGRTLEDLAQEKVFGPFSMTRSSYVWQAPFESDFAVGHNADGDTLRKNRRSKANAAGSLETTISDMTRFVAGVMQGVGVSAASKLAMFTPQIAITTKHQFPSLNTDTAAVGVAARFQLAYGLGWGLFKSSLGRVYFKEGHDDGWQHYVICFPDHGAALVMMGNSDNTERIYKELVERMAGIEIPWEWEGYTPYRATVALPLSVLQQWVGEYDGRERTTIFVDPSAGAAAGAGAGSPGAGPGRLRVKGAHIPTMTLYAADEHHFFLKRTDATVTFSRTGDTVRAHVVDDGEQYDLTRINGNPLLSYEGTFETGTTHTHKLVFSVQQGHLYVEATNESDRLPRLELHPTEDTTSGAGGAAGGEQVFSLKEAPLKFRFIPGADGLRVVTFGGSSRDVEWTRVKE